MLSDNERNRLNTVARVTFSDKAVAELEELLPAFADYADPAAKGRKAPLFMAPDWRPDLPQSSILNALVVLVETIWRENGGQGHGARWDKDSDKHGALVCLLQELFAHAGVRKPPSSRTLRRAIQAARQNEASPAT